MKGRDRSCVCGQSEMRIEIKLLLGGAWSRPHLLLELMHIYSLGSSLSGGL